MIVREMLAEDIPQLAQLYKQFWDEESCVETMKKTFIRLNDSGSYILLSAVEDELIIGSVMGVICWELYGKCKPFMVLENMIVDKKYRSHGVGKALIAELEEKASENNCTQIILVTETNRIDARKLYESAGYNPETHKGYKKKLK